MNSNSATGSVPVSRTPAQSAASQSNGSKSSGPTTPAGLARSSLNSIRSGVTARCVLLPGESFDDHREQLEGWRESLQPRSPAEAFITARIADANVRLDRVGRVEEWLMLDALAKHPAALKLNKAETAAQAAERLALAFEGRAALSYDHLGEMATGLRQTFKYASDADVPHLIVERLRVAVDDEIAFARGGLDAGACREVACAARDVQAMAMMTAKFCTAELDQKRAHLVQDPTIASENGLKRLHRHRTRVLSEVQDLLGLLEKVRALARSEPSGSSDPVISIDLKVVERAP